MTILGVHGAASAAGNIRVFPPYKCCYTLPSEEWSWLDPNGVTQAVCAAGNGSGVVIMLTVLQMPPGTVIDEKFAAGFDPDGYQSVQKRGSRITTFKGLSCYECEWLQNGNKTSAIRVVIANGFAYQLQLVGNSEPVEKRPDYQGIMNGFEFTTPPVAPDPFEAGKALARRLGEIAVYCLFGALVLGLLIRGASRKQPTCGKSDMQYV